MLFVSFWTLVDTFCTFWHFLETKFGQKKHFHFDQWFSEASWTRPPWTLSSSEWQNSIICHVEATFWWTGGGFRPNFSCRHLNLSVGNFRTTRKQINRGKQFDFVLLGIFEKLAKLQLEKFPLIIIRITNAGTHVLAIDWMSNSVIRQNVSCNPDRHRLDTSWNWDNLKQKPVTTRMCDIFDEKSLREISGNFLVKSPRELLSRSHWSTKHRAQVGNQFWLDLRFSAEAVWGNDFDL